MRRRLGFRGFYRSLVMCGTLLAWTGASNLTAATIVRVLTAAYDQNSGFNTQDTGEIAGPLAFAQSGPFADYGGSFYAKAFAKYDPVAGPLLGAYSTMVNTYPLYQSFTPAEAWWRTDFIVTGAPGTQVTYNFGLHLNDALSATEYPGYQNNLGAEAYARLSGVGAAAGLSIIDDVTNLASSLAANRSVWVSRTYNVGATVTVGGDLYTDATAQGGTATVDAFSTGLFALQVVTPGGGYAAENGVVFATSFNEATVPEPSTIVLGGLGSLFLLLRQRRSRDSRPRR